MGANQAMTGSTDLDIGTLSGHLWESANVLRGPVDAADFRTYIFALLFVNAVKEVSRERSQGVLADDHIARFMSARHSFTDLDGLAQIVNNERTCQ